MMGMEYDQAIQQDLHDTTLEKERNERTIGQYFLIMVWSLCLGMKYLRFAIGVSHIMRAHGLVAIVASTAY